MLENGETRSKLAASKCMVPVKGVCVHCGHGGMCKQRCEAPMLGALGTRGEGGLVPGERHGIGR